MRMVGFGGSELFMEITCSGCRASFCGWTLAETGSLWSAVLFHQQVLAARKLRINQHRLLNDFPRASQECCSLHELGMLHRGPTMLKQLPLL